VELPVQFNQKYQGCQMKENRRKTLKHFNVPGQAHGLTFTCFQRKTYLSSDRAKGWLAESVNETKARLNYMV
jgi:REP-associated tyrosine transposase